MTKRLFEVLLRASVVVIVVVVETSRQTKTNAKTLNDNMNVVLVREWEDILSFLHAISLSLGQISLFLLRYAALLLFETIFGRFFTDDVAFGAVQRAEVAWCGAAATQQQRRSMTS